MKVIVFTRNGEKIPQFPDREGLELLHVQFSSSKLDDLLLIAKYRVISFPMSIIVDGRGKVLMKIKGTIPESYVDDLLKK